MRGSHIGHCLCHTLQNVSQVCGKHKMDKSTGKGRKRLEMQELNSKTPEWL